MLTLSTFLLGLVAQAGDAGTPPLELVPTSYRNATTKEAEWTVLEIDGFSRLHFLPSAGSNQMLFLGDVGSALAWRGKRLWCVVPRVANLKDQVLWGPVRVSVATSPEMLRQMREAAAKSGQGLELVALAEKSALTPAKIRQLREAAEQQGRSWKLLTLEEKAALSADSERQLLMRLEAEGAPDWPLRMSK